MYTAGDGNSTDLEACVARKLASSLYLAFNGKGAATGIGRAVLDRDRRYRKTDTIQLHPCFQCGASDNRNHTRVITITVAHSTRSLGVAAQGRA